MTNDYNVILIDEDERNARPTMVDNRRPSGVGIRRPGSILVPPSTRPTVIQTGRTMSPQAYYQPQQPTVIYHQPASSQTPGLAGMTTAELIELGAQLLAAIQPLPGAPVAQGDIETDVENLVIYQTALATHAKRDEQLRTLGGLLARFLRR